MSINTISYGIISHIGYDIYEEGFAIMTIHKLKIIKSFYISTK